MSQALHLASTQSFQCHSCGRCCRNSWDIRVEAGARQGIAASSAAQRCEKEGYLPLVVLADGTVATGRRQDGACVFLTGKELCSIHGELGGGRKPLACQLYPYSLTATPDGYFASLSFACPSVVEGVGGNLEANRRELQALLEERSSGDVEVPHQVEIVAGRFVSWASYRALEGKLLLAYRADDPIGSLLDCAVGIVGAVIRGEETSPWPDLSTVIREEPFEESLLAMFCASVIALWELPDHPEDRQAFSQAVLSGLPVHSQRYDLPLPSLDFGKAEGQLIETFDRYFANAIHGKSLLAGPVVSRLLALACGCALVMYYGNAFRQAEGAAELSWKALSRAFELVEADLVTHTRSADPLFAAFEGSLCQAHQIER